MKQFRPGKKMTLFVVLLLPLVTALGVWQLERGAQKRALEMQYLNQLTALPTRLHSAEAPAPFQRIKLEGRYGDQVFLVDNQIHRGRTGYWIVQVFDEVGGKRLLVNRGFVAGASQRSILPEVSHPAEQLRLVGTVWPYTGLIPVLDEDLWPTSWPKRVQRLDIRRMADLVGALPFEVRLEAGQPGVMQAAPFAAVLSDAKHLGYAATWFGLALALLVAYLLFGYRSSAPGADKAV